MTTRRWAWKRLSFEECSSPKRKCLRAQVIHRSDETSKVFQLSVAERSINRGRFLVTTPGDIRSELT
ncbi:hypothetical protein M6B38_103240 [Iris pallida]|uniref:Uncharacterized protein n=1 Tax=Iris pallida TaxID=29817 RepID=A0AAX6FDG1_IRIPA|nr:hypothetical protein M6B38_103240 [Iris pallida]